MAASQAANFNLQEFSDIGQLLVGGRLYTYAYGTTAQKTAYTDPDGAVPHTYTLDGAGGQYIALNARGELPGPLYLAPGSYDLTLRRTDGSTVWTRKAEGVDAVGASALAKLADSGGAPQIGYLLAAGLYLRNVAERLQDDVDLMSFIPLAERPAIVAKTSQYDASSDIARAIAFCSLLPNGTRLVAPRGKFRCAKAVPFKSNVTLVGKAKMATEFEFTHMGDGFVSSNPINSSTAANIALEQCSVTCTNALNTGGGFVDVGGTFVDLYKVRFSGWKYNVIFDQTEIATIDLCDSLQAAYSVAGLWLVNGPDHTLTAKTVFTNRITVTRTQFNAAVGAQCNVLDDGGSNHSYRDNNFNGGATGIRASGVAGLTIDNNEMEGHTGEDVYLGDTTLSGAFVGPCHGFSIRDNVPISGSGGRNVTIQNAMTGTITGNVFGQAAAAINFINGAANQATGIVIEANSKIITGAARTAGVFVSGFSRSSRQNALRQGAATYVPLATAAGTVTLTPAAMEFITLGTRLHVSNEDGTNGEDTIVTAVTAATFTCALVSAKAANFVVRGATPQNSEEEGSWTPSIGATGTSGAHAYSVQSGQYTRRGNVIHVTGSIEVSAKDVALNGTIQIRGLPYVSEAVLNGNSFANIALYGGFAFPAGYTQMAGIIFPGSSTIDLRRSGSAVALTTVSNSEIPGSTVSLYFEATYLTSAS